VAFLVDSTLLKKQSDNNYVLDLNAPFSPTIALIGSQLDVFFSHSDVQRKDKRNGAIEGPPTHSSLAASAFFAPGEGKVLWYARGPTMYGHSHPGHGS
jgi:hypothetical protein